MNVDEPQLLLGDCAAIERYTSRTETGAGALDSARKKLGSGPWMLLSGSAMVETQKYSARLGTDAQRFATRTRVVSEALRVYAAALSAAQDEATVTVRQYQTLTAEMEDQQARLRREHAELMVAPVMEKAEIAARIGLAQMQVEMLNVQLIRLRISFGAIVNRRDRAAQIASARILAAIGQAPKRMTIPPWMLKLLPFMLTMNPAMGLLPPVIWQGLGLSSRKVLGQRTAMTQLKISDYLAFIPYANKVSSKVGMFLKIRDGKIPVHEMISSASGTVRAKGAKTLNPATYLTGVALGMWNTVFEEGGKADFSQETRSNVWTYMKNHPLDAVNALQQGAQDGVVKVAKNFVFW